MKKSGLSLSSKIQYIWDYYKVPLFTAALLIYIICYIIFRHATDRDILLYVAAVNTPVQKETEDFINSFPESDYAVSDADAKDSMKSRNAIVDLAKDLYLTSDPDSEYHQYVYASRLKILASIEAEKLDIVLADREAMDAFAAQGFLMPLESVFADDPQILARLETGTVILEDNQIDVLLECLCNPFKNDAWCIVSTKCINRNRNFLRHGKPPFSLNYKKALPNGKAFQTISRYRFIRFR